MDEVIAIDGPAASGKSSAAAELAKRLTIPYISTGSMFRAVTLAAIRSGIVRPEDCTEAKLAKILSGLKLEYELNAGGAFELKMNGEFPGAALRSPEVAALVSPVAAVGCVREYLKRQQRALAAGRMVVMEGRDIGTVIFPEARWKFFITATPEERARRRLAQEGDLLAGQTLAEVARGIAERDRIDSTRAIAPLRPAADAEVIDNTELQLEDVVNRILKKIKK